MDLPVVIIGAGVSGLALAQGLRKHNVSFRIFERDSSLSARTQGYRVRISEPGITALRNNLPVERFERLERCCAIVQESQGNTPLMRLDAITASPSGALFQGNTALQIATTGKPWSADRSVLRTILSEDLDPYLEYGKEYERYEEDGDGVVVTFKDSTTVRGSVLVGADGVWSTVRRQLVPKACLLDTEGRLIYGRTRMPPPETAQNSLHPLCSSGITAIRDSQDSLFCLVEPMRFERNETGVPDDYIYWALILRKNQVMPDQELLQLPTSGITSLVQSLTKAWHPSLHFLFNTTQMTLTRIVSAPPSIEAFDKSAQITLIGDAVHAMAPTAAFGATTALQDAGVLAKELRESRDVELSPLFLRRYENEMRSYANEALERSSVGGKAVFGMRPWNELVAITA